MMFIYKIIMRNSHLSSVPGSYRGQKIQLREFPVLVQADDRDGLVCL